MGESNLVKDRHGVTRRTFMGQAATVTAAAAMTTFVPRSSWGANERLGFGVIGTGGRGNAHLSALRALKEEGVAIDIVAVSDLFQPRLKSAAEKYEVEHMYQDYRELLADPRVDVVSIATPDHHHGFQALDAIAAGKDVYCEKPVTHWRQFDLTKRLAQAVEKSDCVFQLGTQGMSDGAWSLMRKLVQDGLIGQPIHAECGYFRVGDWGERGMPIDDPEAKEGADINWDAFLLDSPKKPYDVSRFFRWRMYEDYAGGPVTDLFPHSLTPVVSILGVKMPEAVVGTGGKFRYEEREVPDTFNMLIDYPEKITVAVLGTQGNDYQGTGGRGAGARIPVIRGWDGTLTVVDKEVVFKLADEKNSKKKAQRFPIENGENFNGYWKSFIECCRTRNKNTLSPMEMAFQVQTALQMAMLGYREGKTARFDEKRVEIVL